MDNIAFDAVSSSLKVYKQGTGSFVIPAAGSGTTSSSHAAITHDYGSDELIFQVSIDSLSLTGAMIPWMSNDGRLKLWPRLNTLTLDIVGQHDATVGAAIPARTVTYYYRILIP